MINENKVNFKTLEKEIFRFACESGLKYMKEYLEDIDSTLRENRDKKQLRCKGKRKMTIVTMMGDLEIERQIYQFKDEEGNRGFKYLLDEYLDFDTIGKISKNLVELALENVVETSFRQSSQNIKLATNQNLSHTAIHNIAKAVGDKLIEKEETDAVRHKYPGFKAGKEPNVLFQEQDGFYIKLQGKDRSKSRKNCEVKVGMAHSGWKKRSPGSKEYVLVDKVFYTGISSSKEFEQLSSTTLAKNFNLDEVKVTLINGDGAKWIKDHSGIEKSYSQIDQFHIAQAITRGIRDKNIATKMKKYISKGEPQKSLDILIQLLIENNENEKVFKRLCDLYNYLSLNRDRLIPIHLREDIELPLPPAGIEYRTLGNMEHNIDFFTRRFKRKGRSWSINGARKLSKIVAAKLSKGISYTLDEISTASPDFDLDKLKEIEIATTIRNQMPKFKKEYTVRKGQIPFVNSAVSNGRKTIKNIFNLREFSELTYR